MAWTVLLSQGRVTCALLLKSASQVHPTSGWISSSSKRARRHGASFGRLFSTTPSSTSTPEHSPSDASSIEDSSDETTATTTTTTTAAFDPTNIRAFAPWNNHFVSPDAKNEKVVVNRKFRQHVNPLALRYQQPTILSPQWPNDVYRDTSLPLILDIGCGKGGFLLDLAQHYGGVLKDRGGGDRDRNDNDNDDTLESPLPQQQPQQQPYNYLGLEIRPPVVRYAQSRIERHGLTGYLDYVGCNANVDLDRLLQLYHGIAKQDSNSNSNSHSSLRLHLVTIQFPDPHFKSHHVKRRVVTPQLVQTICRYMPPNSKVFLQSDVKNVLDDMRLQFRQCASTLLEDVLPELDQYVVENILGVSTERERSVLKRDLPVYRAVFQRTNAPIPTAASDELTTTGPTN